MIDANLPTGPARESVLFQHLMRAACGDLADKFDRRAAPRGRSLFVEGDEAEEVFLILRGKVKLCRTAVGREHIVLIAGPGETFGELSLFDPGTRTATATAVTDLTLAVFSHHVVREWIASQPDVAMELLTMFVQRLRHGTSDRSDMVFFDLPGRVARVLLSLQEKFGVTEPPETLVRHGLSQGEIAQLVGASRERVSRVLSAFADRGLIRIGVKSFTILDRDGLAYRAR